MRDLQEKVLYTEAATQPIDVNLIRTGVQEGSILLQFGRDNEELNEITINTNICFPPHALSGIIQRLLETGLYYEEEYKCSIGIKEMLSEE